MSVYRAFLARGLRCRALVVIGAVWVLMGAGVATGASSPPPGIAFAYIPTPARVVLWVAPGLGAIITGWRQAGTGRVPGWLMIMPTIRVASYLLAWVLWLVPGTQNLGEFRHGWFIAATYAAMIAAVLLCAAIPEHLHPGRDRAH